MCLYATKTVERQRCVFDINSYSLNERHRNNYTLALLSLTPFRNRRKVNAYNKQSPRRQTVSHNAM